jgi:hypothetical protein
VVEEQVCHGFAATMLIPPSVTLPSSRPTPQDVIDLHDRTEASWPACAIAVAQRSTGTAAVILLRQTARIAFAATTPALGWWNADSPLAPTGPLARALTRPRQTAKRATYGWRTSAETVLWADTLRVHAGLAVAVLTDRPSDGQVNVLPEPQPGSEALACERCPDGWRTTDWCDRCHGRRCNDCGSCGCATARAPAKITCKTCWLEKSSVEFPDPQDPTCQDCR